MHTKEHWFTSMSLHGPYPELAVVACSSMRHILSWLRWACAQMAALVFLDVPRLFLNDVVKARPPKTCFWARLRLNLVTISSCCVQNEALMLSTNNHGNGRKMKQINPQGKDAPMKQITVMMQ